MLRSIEALLAAFSLGTAILAQQQPAANVSNCRVASKVVRLDGLSEASGIAASRRTAGLLWAHNDSGDPVIVAIDSQGGIKSKVRVTGATVDDWEDIAVGPCPPGSCLYIADIGDNSGSRKHVTLYRVTEPAPTDTATKPAEAFHATYPDGPHDAEALFVLGESDVFILTKGDPGPVALYKLQAPLKPGTTSQMQRIGGPVATGRIEAKDRPTAADVSPDGQWVAVRTTKWIAFYRTSDLTAGRWREVFRADVSELDEPRGEGVAFVDNNTLVLVGEAGGLLKGPGTFARLTCTFSQR